MLTELTGFQALLKHSPLSTAAHAAPLLPALLSACVAPDWGTRRAAADALLALVAHHPSEPDPDLDLDPDPDPDPDPDLALALPTDH